MIFHPVPEILKLQPPCFLIDLVFFEYASSESLNKLMHACCFNLHIVLAYPYIQCCSPLITPFIQLIDNFCTILTLHRVLSIHILLQPESPAIYPIFIKVLACQALQSPPNNILIKSNKASFQLIIDKVSIVDNLVDFLFGIVVKLNLNLKYHL